MILKQNVVIKLIRLINICQHFLHKCNAWVFALLIVLAYGYVTDSFEDDFITLMRHSTTNINFKWSTGKVRMSFIELLAMHFIWQVRNIKEMQSRNVLFVIMGIEHSYNNDLSSNQIPDQVVDVIFDTFVSKTHENSNGYKKI